MATKKIRTTGITRMFLMIYVMWKTQFKEYQQLH